MHIVHEMVIGFEGEHPSHYSTWMFYTGFDISL